MPKMKSSFEGLKVTSFESRRASEIDKLIRYHGGIPRVAPSIKEIPVEDSSSISLFAELLFEGKIDVLILLTGVGTTLLFETIIKRYGKDIFIAALRKTTIISRGSKPSSSLSKYGLKPDFVVPDPNTWKDVLETVDKEVDVSAKTVAVQEYGVSNPDFISELEKRGAKVLSVSIYRWGLPDDVTPLRDAIRSISEGKEDVVLFTSSQQVVNLMEIAEREGMLESLYRGFDRVLVSSIGPSTTQTLKKHGLSVDYEVDTPKMGNLVRETARVARRLLRKKRIANDMGVRTRNWKRIDMVWEVEESDLRKVVRSRSCFMKACFGEKTDYTPVWLMRQAGRFLREYRELRSKVSFLDLCKTPELASEVTLMAVDRLGVDAAIIFSDILIILEPLGINIEYSRMDGPLIKKVVRSKRSLDSLKEFDQKELDFVYRAIEITRKALDPDKALIGFAGAPFTIASYVIEGGASRNYINTKELMYKDREFWDAFMKKLVDAISKYLSSQVEAGADALQIFDSWVGCLSPEDYEEYVFPYMRDLIGKLPSDIPVILFGTGTSSLLELIRDTGCSVVGLDWRVDISEAWKRIGYDTPIQGNMDPVKLFAPSSYIEKEVSKILKKVEGKPGYIFNLGHGVLPRTPVDNVLKLVDTVHELSSN